MSPVKTKAFSRPVYAALALSAPEANAFFLSKPKIAAIPLSQCLDRNTARATGYLFESERLNTPCRTRLLRIGCPHQPPAHVSVSPHCYPGRSVFPSPVGDLSFPQ